MQNAEHSANDRQVQTLMSNRWDLLRRNAMSNGTQINRMWQLWTKISMMVLDGKRDPESVAKILQGILNSSVESSFPRCPTSSRSGRPSSSAQASRMPQVSGKAISDAKMRIGNYADDILGKPAFKASDTEAGCRPGHNDCGRTWLQG